MKRESDEQVLEAMRHASPDPYDQLDRLIGESCRVMATPLLRLALEVALIGAAVVAIQIRKTWLRFDGAGQVRALDQVPR